MSDLQRILLCHTFTELDFVKAEFCPFALEIELRGGVDDFDANLLISS
jgi:hypothetical protein